MANEFPIELTHNIGLDSPDLLPDLGKDSNSIELRAWLSASYNRDRFDPDNVKDAITEIRGELDDEEDAAKVEDDKNRNNRLQGIRNLCEIVEEEMDNHKSGPFRAILEKIKLYTLTDLLSDPESEMELRSSGFRPTVVDRMVAKAVLRSFFDVIVSNSDDAADEDVTSNFSQN